MADIDWTGRKLSTDDDPLTTGREAVVEGRSIAVYFSDQALAARSIYKAMDKAEEKTEAALARGEFPTRIDVKESDF